MFDELFSRDRFHILDGAMGTMLQNKGLKLGTIPETLSVTDPQLIIDIHKQYIDAGSEVIYANTFGANSLKLKNTIYTTQQIIEKSIENARIATRGTNVKVALDIGPLGVLLQPSGTLSFDEAYDLFKEIITFGKDADLIVFETFNDLYELKSAILAGKENSDLPILCSMSFEENGRTFTGCTVESFCQTAMGLGVSAVGINCGLGPKQILPLFKRLSCCASENFPLFVKPNAGLPRADGSGYDINSTEFAEIIALFADLGLLLVGGCCGTTPEFIAKTKAILSGKKPCENIPQNSGYICSPTRAVDVSSITVIGERINPTGKKRFQQALREKDYDYILGQAIEQVESGASILDVNVGIPDIDETEVLTEVIKSIQSVVDVPLQIDSSSPQALEKALRYYNGKPIVNSVNGEEKSLSAILPLCKKYGASVVGLTLDENGIPNTAIGRFEIAKRIVNRAIAMGIDKKDIYIDCLTMTVSADQNNAVITLEALKKVKDELGVKTILGVSNISFGLPARGNLNATFLTLAMHSGLDLAIINPNAEEMMAQVYSFRALNGIDEGCSDYIKRYKNMTLNTVVSGNTQKSSEVIASSLKDCVVQGLKNKAREITLELIKTTAPLDIIDGELIPALDQVGIAFESGKAFLPELLASATSAQYAFEVIKDHLSKSGLSTESKGKIVLATVKGDIHDIGKNIVKVILENYGFTVLDLGRDVPPESVVEAIKTSGAKMVGLSALMTTTVKSMEQTINAIHAENLDCKIVVGGAVLTEEYALKIGANFYAKDAKKSADIAKSIYK